MINRRSTRSPTSDITSTEPEGGQCHFGGLGSGCTRRSRLFGEHWSADVAWLEAVCQVQSTLWCPSTRVRKSRSQFYANGEKVPWQSFDFSFCKKMNYWLCLHWRGPSHKPDEKSNELDASLSNRNEHTKGNSRGYESTSLRISQRHRRLIRLPKSTSIESTSFSFHIHAAPVLFISYYYFFKWNPLTRWKNFTSKQTLSLHLCHFTFVERTWFGRNGLDLAGSFFWQKEKVFRVRKQVKVPIGYLFVRIQFVMDSICTSICTKRLLHLD